jgi:glutamate dehydrogenase
VAADKGTANLSDTANSISLSKKFWLGDAFASGGSKGYSHKAFGITAKGALVTADRNLRCLGFDFRTKSVRVVGIGDMGGDVFGNGLIESEHFELIAAFNHKHIFLDPTPDSKKSFLERKRLFFDKNSGWDCYDKSIISKGGGVFLRTEKSIPISIEVQKALDINKTKLSGAELIQSILKAPMDLLYNGGIGTYIKASWEETNRIGDPANNDVRVNGNEIRAKVVSEGGNLGCTQSSRLEMDWGGVLIFSDAIDNSAGVDLSDHEVNLKIFFQELLDSGKIKNETERDRYLEAFGPEVAKLVLEDNSYQSLSINSDRMVSSIEGWEFIKNSIHYLSSRKILDLKQNELPLNEEDWSEWQKNSPEFPRSALGIIFAHAKMDWFEFLSKENEIPMEEFRELYLGYFPKELGKKFEKELLSHPLRKEIFITTAMNLFMNFFGMKGYLILVQKENPLAIFVEILRYLRDKNLIEIFQKMSNHRNTQEELSIYQLLNVLRDQVLGQFFSGKSSQLPGLKEFSSLLPLAEKNHLSSMGIEFR